MVCAALVALTSAGVAAADTLRQKEARRDGIRALLTYVAKSDYGFRDARLTVWRHGRVVHKRAVPGQYQWPGKLGVRDLDLDGEHEILLTAYTGRVHCCSVIYAYRWTGRTYISRRLNTGSTGYRERDLDRDGRPEWVAGDDRFKYLFTSYADSYTPIRIHTYRNDGFVVVTRRFAAAIRVHERAAWRAYLRERRTRDVRGILAAWAADKYLLGEGRQVWPALDDVVADGDSVSYAPPPDRRYVAQLRATLRCLGYFRFG